MAASGENLTLGNGWLAVIRIGWNEPGAPEQGNPLSDAFPCCERERPFSEASCATEFVTAARLADVDSGNDAQYFS